MKQRFAFVFKGNQEGVSKQMAKIKGICCVKKCSLISEMKVLYICE